jgi:hypothetical protein
VIDFFAVWTAGSVLAAIVGGLLLGFVVVSRFDNPRFTAIESVGVVALLGGIAGFVFWAAQIADTLFADGPSLAWRVVSRFGLWVVFTLSLAVGTGVGIRFRRGSWG